MADLAISSVTQQKSQVGNTSSIDNAVNKLTDGDAQKVKELFKEVANILSGDSVKVSNGGTAGVDGNKDTTKTTGATSTPALDNPDDTKAKEANLEKLISYLQLDNEERQTAMAKDRIELQQHTLDAEHEERMDQIDDSIAKMKKAESASKWSRAFSWIGAVLSVVAAVVLTAVTGGAAAGFAIAGAVLAVSSLVMNETGAMDALTEKLAESLQNSGMSKNDAQLAASLILNIGIMALSAGCSIGGMIAGVSATAAAAAKLAETGTRVLGMTAQTVKTVQTALTIVGTGVTAASLATSGVNTYLTKRSEDAKADTTELEKFITQLQQRLEESQEELQALLEQIESGISEIAQMVGSATDTSSEIAQNIGQMA